MPHPEHSDPRLAVEPSPEQIPDPRHRDILTRLEQSVGQIQDSDTFRRYLDMQARFHRYSWSNVALILAARPDATQVAGYQAWLRMHRYVRRGEKAIKIFVPFFKKVVDDQGVEGRFLTGFGVGHVFDVDQTDGEPLARVEVPVLTGEDGAGLFDHLVQVVDREGLRLRTQPDFPGELMGYYEPAQREIVLRDAARLQMTKTLAHELAHHFAGHGLPGDVSPRAEQETVAESVSYVTLAHYGLDSGERSFPYIAVWSKEQKLLRNALGQIQRISATLIDRVEAAAGGPAGSPEAPNTDDHYA